MRLIHHYPAVRLPDGTHEIHELDVFAECSRLNPHTGEVDVFDIEWLRAAARQATARQAEGYLAPAHLGHHDPLREDEPPLAGFLRDLRVDPPDEHDNSGDAVAVLRATVTGIPDDVFARIRDTRLPYRSVEIHSPDEPEINSLALLETTVPFFKFPLTRVSEQDANASEPTDANAAAGANANANSGVAGVAGIASTDPGDGPDANPAGNQATPPAPACPDQLMAGLPGAVGVRFHETADRHLQCFGAFSGAGDETRVNVLLARVQQVISELREQTDVPTDPPGSTFTDDELTSRIRALANAGYVFSEPAVRALVAGSSHHDRAFTALRKTLPQAPVCGSRPRVLAGETAHTDGPDDADSVLDELVRRVGRAGDAAVRREARAAWREFGALESRFRAIGCRFSRADYVRARIAPVCTEHAN
jgi:hypothetical protein